jgi:hypothetical protein
LLILPCTYAKPSPTEKPDSKPIEALGRLDISYAVTLIARYSPAPDRCPSSVFASTPDTLSTRESLLATNTALTSTCRRFQDLVCRQQRSTRVSEVHSPPGACWLRRRVASVTGLSFCLAGGAIAFKSKLQLTVAISSTESEFIAAVLATKVAK